MMTVENDPYSIDTAPASDKGPMERGSEGATPTDKETALLPKTMFGDKSLEPGSKCTFEVVKVHGDEVEVKYSKQEEPEMEPGLMESAELGLDQLATGFNG